MRGHTRSGLRPPYRSRGEQGQTLAEFILVLTIFLFLVLGVVDFSRIVYARSIVAQAAREGARVGVIRSEDTPENDAAIIKAAKALVVGVNPDELVITVTRPSKHIQVDASYTFHPLIALMANFVDGGNGEGFVLRARSLMRAE